MIDWGTILSGIAACITAVSGGLTTIWAVRRASPKERRDAARGVIERAIDPGGDDEQDDVAELRIAVEQLREQLKRKDGPQ